MDLLQIKDISNEEQICVEVPTVSSMNLLLDLIRSDTNVQINEAFRDSVATSYLYTDLKTNNAISLANSYTDSEITSHNLTVLTAANEYTNEQLGIVCDSIKDPFQQFTSELSVIEDVVTIKRSSGMFPYAYISSDASIVIDSSSFPNNGILPVGGTNEFGTSSVKFSLSVDSNELTFDQTDIEYIEPFEILENSWNTIYFEKTGSGNWKAITW